MLTAQRFPPAIGGVERHLQALAERLPEEGFDPVVVTTDLRTPRPWVRFLRGDLPASEPYPVHRHRAFLGVSLPNDLGIVSPGLARDLLREPAEILHAHGFAQYATWAAAWAASLRQIPLVITTHADPGRPHWGRRILDGAVRMGTLQGARRIIAQTELERRYLARIGVARERIRVIPGAVDIARIPDPPPREVNPSRPVRVLFVGRVDFDQKGVDLLLEAAERLASRVPILWKIAGEISMDPDLLHRRIQRISTSVGITLTGRRSQADLGADYREADILVVPSRFEPFGLVVLEGMAHGLPIVASRVGGIPEIVGESGAALWAAGGDAEGLADAIARLAADPGLRRQMGWAGRERALAFDVRQYLPQLARVYHEAMDEGPVLGRRS